MRHKVTARLVRKVQKWNESAGVKYANLLKYIFPNRTKIKLVAIAKDEAAYLADWIFHHLYFGFNQIDIYVNNTTDNTAELIEALRSLENVSFVDGDRFFAQSDRAPQLLVYSEALKRARWEGYSHIMFLDIDEFYTPISFELDIGSFLSTLSADVCCLEWIHKLDEEVPFSGPFEPELIGRRAQQVKSILRTSVVPKLMNPHNIYADKVNYQLADGSYFTPNEEVFSRVPVEELAKPVKPVFVLHRMVRHQIEYIAALKRGRPIQSEKQGSMFKDNRSGIFERHPSETIVFPQKKIETYQKSKLQFIERYHLESIIAEGQECVLRRFTDVLEMIASAPINESETLKKILKNVTLSEVIEAYQQFKEQHTKKI